MGYYNIRRPHTRNLISHTPRAAEGKERLDQCGDESEVVSNVIATPIGSIFIAPWHAGMCEYRSRSHQLTNRNFSLKKKIPNKIETLFPPAYMCITRSLDRGVNVPRKIPGNDVTLASGFPEILAVSAERLFWVQTRRLISSSFWLMDFLPLSHTLSSPCVCVVLYI